MPRGAAIAIVLLFVLTRGWLLFGFQPDASDTSVYFSYACRAFDLGETAYAGDLKIEFPPVAWWVMASAYEISGQHVSTSSTAQEIAAGRAAYMQAFRRQMAVFDAAAFAFFLLTVRRRHPEWLLPAGLIYIACTTLLAHPLYDRLDAGLLMLFMAAAYCHDRATDGGRRATGWIAASCALLGIGVAYKVIPALVIPFVLAGEMRGPGGWRRAGLAAIAAALASGLPLGAQYLRSGPGVFAFLGFHASRGIQLESLFATLTWIGGLFGAPARIELWEGGANLAGGWEPAAKMLSTAALAALLGALGLLALRRRGDRPVAMRLGLLAVVDAVILSKVLSPQYFIWALPIALLLLVGRFRPNARGFLVAALLVLTAGLTTWVFPYHYFGFAVNPVGLEVPNPSVLLSPDSADMAVVSVRNVVYLVCAVVLTAQFSRRAVA